ncbi:MAG TPA: hypothetical protein VG248_17265 [Caulobacteraceae bacterium]|jgi:hypothetical protein|nr:hypothetical protein [Caulobacteraceae bacterium]
MTTRYELRDITARILKGATPAGPRVFTPGDLPTWDGEYPVIRVYSPRERRTSKGKGGSALYDVIATIRIVLTVQAPPDATTWGQMEVEGLLEPIEQQLLQLLVNNPELRTRTSQFSEIDSQAVFSADGLENLGELQLDIDMDFDAGPESSWNPGAPPLTEVAVAFELWDPATTRQQKAETLAQLGEDVLGGSGPEIGLLIPLTPPT